MTALHALQDAFTAAMECGVTTFILPKERRADAAAWARLAAKRMLLYDMATGELRDAGAAERCTSEGARATISEDDIIEPGGQSDRVAAQTEVGGRTAGSVGRYITIESGQDFRAFESVSWCARAWAQGLYRALSGPERWADHAKR